MLWLARSAALLCAGLGSAISVASAADKEPAKPNPIVKVAGILIDKQDKRFTVKADGEEAVVTYVVPKEADKKLLETLKGIFNASRVQLTYRMVGNERHLVSIKKQVFKATGTVTGSVVKVHNDFWVEVKPKNGLADAFAPGANYNDKEFMARLRGLKPGDTVTIKYYTDFERHRIESLQKHDDRTKKEAK